MLANINLKGKLKLNASEAFDELKLFNRNNSRKIHIRVKNRRSYTLITLADDIKNQVKCFLRFKPLLTLIVEKIKSDSSTAVH